MTKILQRKFVLSTMLAITILLAFLLGAINISNAVILQKQNEQLLNSLLFSQAFSPPAHPDFRVNNHWFFSPAPNENSRLSAVYFFAKVSASNTIIHTDTSHIASIDQTQAIKYLQNAIDSGKSEGKTDNFKFASTQINNSNEKLYVFLDTSSYMHSVLRLLALSAAIGIFFWFMMLLISVLISSRAIRPIAQNIERQKQFITDAGHELKTPLSIILANTEALELHTSESKWSKNIKEQVKRLTQLTQNLLSISKIDETNISKSMVETDISAILNKCVEMFGEAIKLKKLNCVCNIEEHILKKVCPELFLQLCSILVDNAVKYSPQGGTIRLVLFNDKSTILKISNSCISLPPCEPERLFDRFFRADSARTQQNGGYGIGLSSAQSIVHAHNGTIKAEYSNNCIITFTVKL